MRLIPPELTRCGIRMGKCSVSADDMMPSWSCDGRWVYFGSNRTGESQIWRIPADGGTAVQVTRQGGSIGFESPDGAFLYYLKDYSWNTSLWRQRTGGGEEAVVLDAIYAWNFAVSDQGVYFISDKNADDISAIQFLSFTTGVVQFEGLSAIP